jgi:hypothetical protein
VADQGPAGLEGFYAQALRLVTGRAENWRARWRAGALEAASRTGRHLDNIAAEVTAHLAEAGVWSIPAPASTPPGDTRSGDTPPDDSPPDDTSPVDTRAYGMCGRLTTYPASRAIRLA